MSNLNHKLKKVIKEIYKVRSLNEDTEEFHKAFKKMMKLQGDISKEVYKLVDLLTKAEMVFPYVDGLLDKENCGSYFNYYEGNFYVVKNGYATQICIIPPKGSKIERN